MKLTLHTLPEVPLEAEVICPDTLLGCSSEKDVLSQPVYHGNQKATVGDFFRVCELSGDRLEVEGDLSRVKLLGAGMSKGRLVVQGSVGGHLGAAMSGGEIRVEGDAGDWVGREMSGGRIVITGHAGHMVGSAVRGSAVGIEGGEIIVHGNVRNEAGSGMRRGFIAVGGSSGDFTGVNMKAGTIVVLGELGQRTGAGMVRGSVVSMKDAEMLPTFTYSCCYQPSFVRLYLLYLRGIGLEIADEFLTGAYHRWCGDCVELNKGEILLYQG